MEQIIESIDWMVADEIELSYKSRIKPSQRPKIVDSRSTYQLLLQAWETSKIEFVEQGKVIFLNNANRVLGIYNLSTGGTTGTVIDVRVVFAAALKVCAQKIIIAHNHPSAHSSPASRTKCLHRK